MTDFTARIVATLDARQVKNDLNAITSKTYRINILLNPKSNIKTQLETMLASVNVNHIGTKIGKQIAKEIKASIQQALNSTEIKTKSSATTKATKTATQGVVEDKRSKFLDTGKYEAEIAKLQGQLAKLGNFNSTGLRNAKAEIEGIVTALSKLKALKDGGTVIDTSAFDTLEARLQKAKNLISTATSQITPELKKYMQQFQSGNFTALLQRWESDLSSYGDKSSASMGKATASVEQYKLVLERLATEIQEYFANPQNTAFSEKLLHSFQELGVAGRQAATDMRTVGEEMKGALDPGVGIQKQQEVLAYLSQNSRAAKKYGDALKELAQAYAECGTKAEKAKLDTRFATLKSVITRENLGGKTIFDSLSSAFKNVGSFVSAYRIIMQIPRAIKSMVSEVRTVDAEMTTIRKITSATSEELTKMFDDATEKAKAYGLAISDVMKSQADWIRLGYSMDDAKELASVTALFQQVGDNMTQENTSTALITVLKGFNMNVDQATHIVDAYNNVADHMPIATDELAAALSRSASAMSAAGNTMEQTMALITAANSVVQNPEKVGTAFQTIAMRIRAAKSELEEAGLDTEDMLTSVSKIRAELLGLSGVDIMINDDTFKSTYQILDELSNKWGEFTDIQQARITEILAGKRQGNIMSAIMQNFDIAREALELGVNSEGVAQKELENYQKGIEFHFGRLKATFQDFSNTLINSDVIIGFVDALQTLLDVLTKIVDVAGSIPTVLAGFTIGRTLFTFIKEFRDLATLGTTVKFADAFKSMIGIGGATSALSGVDDALLSINKDADLATNSVESLTASVSGSGGSGGLFAALKGIMVKHPFLSITAGATLAVTAILGIVNAVRKYNAEQKKLRYDNWTKALDSFSDKETDLESTIQKITDLRTELEDANTTDSRAYEIKSELYDIQEQLNEAYGTYATNIDIVNGNLQEELDTVRSLTQAEAQRIKNEHTTAYNEAVDALYNKSYGKATGRATGGLVASIDLDDIKKEYSIKKIDVDDNALDDLMSKIKETAEKYDIEIEDSGNGIINFEYKKNTAEAYEDLNSFMTDFEKIVKSDTTLRGRTDIGWLNAFNENLSEAINDAKEVVDKYQDEIELMRQIQMAADSTLYGDEGKQSHAYTWYTKYADAISELNKALATGDGIDEALKNFSSLHDEIYTMIGSDSGLAQYEEMFDKLGATVNQTGIDLYKFQERIKSAFKSTGIERQSESWLGSYYKMLQGIKDASLTDTDIKNMFLPNGIFGLGLGTVAQGKAVKYSSTPGVQSLFDFFTVAGENGAVNGFNGANWQDISYDKIQGLINLLIELGVVSKDTSSSVGDVPDSLEDLTTDITDTLKSTTDLLKVQKTVDSLFETLAKGEDIDFSIFDDEDLLDFAGAIDQVNGKLTINEDKLRKIAQNKLGKQYEANTLLIGRLKAKRDENIQSLEELDDKEDENYTTLTKQNEGIDNNIQRLNALNNTLMETMMSYEKWNTEYNASVSGTTSTLTNTATVKSLVDTVKESGTIDASVFDTKELREYAKAFSVVNGEVKVNEELVNELTDAKINEQIAINKTTKALLSTQYDKTTKNIEKQTDGLSRLTGEVKRAREENIAYNKKNADSMQIRIQQLDLYNQELESSLSYNNSWANSYAKVIDKTSQLESNISAISELLNSITTGKSVDPSVFNSTEMLEYAEAIEYVNGALQVNEQRVKEITEAKVKEQVQLNETAKALARQEYHKNTQAIKELRSEQEALEREYGYLARSNDEWINAQNQIKVLEAGNATLANKCNLIDLYTQSLIESTGAYQEWLNAQDGSDTRDMADNIVKAMDEVKDVFTEYDSSGKRNKNYGAFGTDEYEASVKLLIPETVDSEDREAVKKYVESLRQYFSGNKDGVDRFIYDAIDKGLMEVDDDGLWGIAGEKSMQDFMTGFNMTEDTIMAMMGMLQAYYPELELEWTLPEGDSFKDFLKQNGIEDQEIKITFDVEDKENELKTIEETLKQLQEGGNVDLLNRPRISTERLTNVGWTDAGDGYATLFTNTYTNEDETIAMNFTPIIVDENGNHIGTMSPEELQRYAEEVIAGVREDTLNLKIGATFEGENAYAEAKAAGEEYHKQHEKLYAINDYLSVMDGMTEIINGNDDSLKNAINTLMQYDSETLKTVLSSEEAAEGTEKVKEAFDSLVDALGAYDPEVEEQIFNVLSDLGDNIEFEIPELHLEGFDEDVQMQVTATLNEKGANTIEEIRELQNLSGEEIEATFGVSGTDEIDQVKEILSMMTGDEYDIPITVRIDEDQLKRLSSGSEQEVKIKITGQEPDPYEANVEGKINSATEGADYTEAEVSAEGKIDTATEASNYQKAKLSSEGVIDHAEEGDGYTKAELVAEGKIDTATASSNYQKAKLTGEGSIDSASEGDDYTKPKLHGDGVVDSASEGDGYQKGEFSGTGVVSSAEEGGDYQAGEFSGTGVVNSAEQSGDYTEGEFTGKGIVNSAEQGGSYTDVVLTAKGKIENATEASNYQKATLGAKGSINEASQGSDYTNAEVPVDGSIESAEQGAGYTNAEVTATGSIESASEAPSYKPTQLTGTVKIEGAEEARNSVQRYLSDNPITQTVNLQYNKEGGYGDETYETPEGEAVKYTLELEVTGADTSQQKINATKEVGETYADETFVAEAEADTDSASSDLNDIINLENEITNNPAHAVATLTDMVTAPLLTIEQRLNAIDGKRVTTYIQTVKTGAIDQSAQVNGTAHAYGTALARGSWAVDHDQTALAGELGKELVVSSRDGTWRTVGDHGAEFIRLKKGDIVFNHLQTEQLLKNGYVFGRGTAYASGTAMGYGSSSVSSNGRAQLPDKPAPYNSNSSSTQNNNTTSYNNNTNAVNNNTAATNASTEAKKDEKTVAEKLAGLYDWVAVKIEYFGNRTKEIADRINDYISKAVKMTLLNRQMNSISKEIDVNSRAARVYKQQAEKVATDTGMSSDLVNKAIKGEYLFEELSEEDKEKVEAFLQYYDKYEDAKEQVRSLRNEQLKLYDEWANMPIDIAQENVDKLSDSLSKLSNAYSLVEMGASGLSAYLGTFANRRSGLNSAQSTTRSSARSGNPIYGTLNALLDAQLGDQKDTVTEYKRALRRTTNNTKSAKKEMERLQKRSARVSASAVSKGTSLAGEGYITSALSADQLKQLKSGKTVNTIGIKDSKVLDAIKEYNKYVQLAATANDNAEQSATNYRIALNKQKEALSTLSDAEAEYAKMVVENEQKKFQNIQTYYQGTLEYQKAMADTASSVRELNKAYGEDAKRSDYMNEIIRLYRERSILMTEQVKLQKQLNDSVASGKIKTGSQEYLTMLNTIEGLNKEINSTTTSIISLHNEMSTTLTFQDIEKQLERSEKRLSKIKDLISDIGSAMSSVASGKSALSAYLRVLKEFGANNEAQSIVQKNGKSTLDAQNALLDRKLKEQRRLVRQYSNNTASLDNLVNTTAQNRKNAVSDYRTSKAKTLASGRTILNANYHSLTSDQRNALRKGEQVDTASLSATLAKREAELKKIEERLQKLSQGGGVNLLKRPQIETRELSAAGWKDVGDGYATLFSSTFSNADESIAMNFTPILVDKNGKYQRTLSPEELEKYAEEVIDGVHDDYLNLKIGATFEGKDAINQAVKAAEQYHNLHEELYPLRDSTKSGQSAIDALKNYNEQVTRTKTANAYAKQALDDYNKALDKQKENLKNLASSEEEYAKLIVQIEQEKFKNIQNYYKSIADYRANLADMVSNNRDLKEAFRIDLSKGDFTREMTQLEKQRQAMTEERMALQIQLNKAVKSGAIVSGSEEYNEMAKTINNLGMEINKLTIDMVGLQDQMREETIMTKITKALDDATKSAEKFNSRLNDIKNVISAVSGGASVFERYSNLIAKYYGTDTKKLNAEQRIIRNTHSDRAHVGQNALLDLQAKQQKNTLDAYEKAAKTASKLVSSAKSEVTSAEKAAKSAQKTAEKRGEKLLGRTSIQKTLTVAQQRALESGQTVSTSGIKDSNVLKLITEYNDLVTKAKMKNEDAKHATEIYNEALEKQKDILETVKQAEIDYATMLVENEKQKLDNIHNYYASIQAYSKAVSDNLASARDMKEAYGEDTIKSDYTKEINELQRQRAAMQKEQDLMRESLEKAVNKGIIEIGSQEHYEMKQQISDLGDSIDGITKQILDLQDEMRNEIFYRALNKALDVAEKLRSSLSSISGLIKDEMMFDANGDITALGITNLAMNLKEYQSALNSLSTLMQKREKMIALYNNGKNTTNYNKKEFEADMASITSEIQDMLFNVDTLRTQVTDMMAKTAKAELDATLKVLDARTKLLQKQKEYYDYDKTLRGKTNDLQALEAQLRALEGVTDMESKAMKARLEAQKQQLQEDLDETVREHAYELEIAGLDDLKTALNENYENYVNELNGDLKTITSAVKDATKTVNQSLNTVNTTVETLLDTYNKKLSGEIIGVPKYASGTKRVGKNTMGLTNERGGEIVVTDKGVYMPLSKDSGVIPSYLTQNLFGLAENYGEIMSGVNGNGSYLVAPVVTSNVTINGTNLNEQDLIRAINRQVPEMSKQISNDIRKDLAKSR